jgi:hypothetical protein
MSTGVSEPGGVVRLGGDTSIRRWCVWGGILGGGGLQASFALNDSNDVMIRPWNFIILLGRHGLKYPVCEQCVVCRSIRHAIACIIACDRSDRSTARHTCAFLALLCGPYSVIAKSSQGHPSSQVPPLHRLHHISCITSAPSASLGTSFNPHALLSPPSAATSGARGCIVHAR